MELLAPAGSMEKLKAAVIFGADAVYLSGKEYGLRAFSDNFSLEEMAEALDFAHAHQVKVYVTVNIYARNRDLQGLPDYLRSLCRLQPDALIVTDPGVFLLAREIALEGPWLPVPLHISTQANTTNHQAVRFWRSQGAERVVLARELSWQEIREIHQKEPEMELEAFVHGAMCMSYSGRCLLSNYLTGRDANQGACAQACRWNYQLMEEKRPGQFFPVLEDRRGSYIFNSKDMCLLQSLPLLDEAGVCSLKIEGRMKSAHYVATITKVYREALDAYEKDPASWRLQEHWVREICRISHREYTTGFFLGQDFQDAGINLRSNEDGKSHDFVGLVLDYDEDTGRALIQQRNRFLAGEDLEFVPPSGPNFLAKAKDLRTEAGEKVDSAPHPQQRLTISLDRRVSPWTLVRRA
ncbi:MAG: U32 family peptidase [Peptococcaceae bacterium]|nr:U32 family peptidase [Peptococcaceae bacterium]